MTGLTYIGTYLKPKISSEVKAVWTMLYLPVKEKDLKFEGLLFQVC